jgi:methylmalonyl-CoA mutase cobalamin-binding subunit
MRHWTPFPVPPSPKPQAGACAIFGPGTRITSAAKQVLDKIKEKRGHK